MELPSRPAGIEPLKAFVKRASLSSETVRPPVDTPRWKRALRPLAFLAASAAGLFAVGNKDGASAAHPVPEAASPEGAVEADKAQEAQIRTAILGGSSIPLPAELALDGSPELVPFGGPDAGALTPEQQAQLLEDRRENLRRYIKGVHPDWKLGGTYPKGGVGVKIRDKQFIIGVTEDGFKLDPESLIDLPADVSDEEGLEQALELKRQYFNAKLVAKSLSNDRDEEATDVQRIQDLVQIA